MTGFVTGLAPSLLDGLLSRRCRRAAVAQTVVYAFEANTSAASSRSAWRYIAAVNKGLCHPLPVRPVAALRRVPRLSQNMPSREVFRGVAVVRLVRPRRVLEAPKPKLDVVGRVVSSARIAYRMKCTKIVRACTDVV